MALWFFLGRISLVVYPWHLKCPPLSPSQLKPWPTQLDLELNVRDPSAMGKCFLELYDYIHIVCFIPPSVQDSGFL